MSKLWRAITERSPLPMATVEGTSHIVRYVNPAFCKLLDRPDRELVGKAFREILPDENHCATLLDQVYRTGTPARLELEQHSKSRPVSWSFSMWPIIAEKRSTGVMIQVTETAQLHEATVAMNEALILGSVRQHELTEAADAANAELWASDTAKNHFIAVLSHELRSPLNVILLWSQILRGPGCSDENLRKGLEIIQRSTKAQARLIEDLLDFHRISSGKLRLDLAEVDLAETVRSVLDSMEPEAMEKEIRIDREIGRDPVRVSGDSSRLQQVLRNLLGNAVKFTPKGGRIRVVLRRNRNLSEVEVSDTGQGISTAGLQHVFKSFRQEDPVASHSHAGLGLGLAIAKQLTELHGGTIRAESPGKGAGATFTISLPLLTRKTTRRPQVLLARNAPEGRRPSLVGVLVLVVDDDLDTREALRQVLEEAGAGTMVVGSADAALDAIRQQQPDLILSDLGMPGRDGYDLLRSVRALPATLGGRIPAIALTAFATSEDRDRALDAGFQRHVAKPVEAVKLITLLAAVLSETSRG